MEDVRVGVLPMLVALASAGDGALNHSGSGAATADWWAGVVEEDAIRSLSLDGEGGLWASAFVPPPPRPAYLEENISNDGLTTCDLCTWAWHDRGVFTVDAAQDNSEELGWVLTLAIVSVLSAAIGAVIMVTLLQCRNRIKNIGSTCSLCITRSPDHRGDSPDTAARQGQGHKAVTPPFGAPPPGGGVWTWLSARRSSSGPAQLSATPTTPVENHYTLDEAHYGEALYAELDKESTPAYQNTGYSEEDTDLDAPISSAPSSAYYSDLSGTDRTYEAVGAVTGGSGTGGWEMGEVPPRRNPRLTAITETITVPSDYV